MKKCATVISFASFASLLHVEFAVLHKRADKVLCISFLCRICYMFSAGGCWPRAEVVHAWFKVALLYPAYSVYSIFSNSLKWCYIKECISCCYRTFFFVSQDREIVEANLEVSGNLRHEPSPSCLDDNPPTAKTERHMTWDQPPQPQKPIE